MTRKDYVLLSDTLRTHFAAQHRVVDKEIAQEVSLAIGASFGEGQPKLRYKTLSIGL